MLITFSSTQTKFIVLLLGSLACSCSANSDGGSKSAGRGGDPLGLERVMIGSVYGVGSRFESDGLQFAVEALGDVEGNVQIGPAQGQASPGAKSLQLSHATLRCQGRSASFLAFDFIDGGGQVSLEIEGERRSAADLIALDGAKLGGALVAVSESNTAGVRRGHVSLSGTIDRFAIGGTELVLLDLRISQ